MVQRAKEKRKDEQRSNTWGRHRGHKQPVVVQTKIAGRFKDGVQRDLGWGREITDKRECKRVVAPPRKTVCVPRCIKREGCGGGVKCVSFRCAGTLDSVMVQQELMDNGSKRTKIMFKTLAKIFNKNVRNTSNLSCVLLRTDHWNSKLQIGWWSGPNSQVQ